MISSPASPAYGNIPDIKLDGPEALLFFIFLLDFLIWNKLFLSTQNQNLSKTYHGDSVKLCSFLHYWLQAHHHSSLHTAQ